MDLIHTGCGLSAALALTFGLFSLGCDGDVPPKPGGSGDADRLEISASSITVGFKNGRVRASQTLAAFQITPLPITADQYDQCAKKGACPALDAVATDSAASAENEVAAPKQAEIARGVSPDGAKAFCSWVGGALPTLPQWLLAARGPTPHRFAWGDRLPTCAEHPGGVNVAVASTDERLAAVERVRAAASYEPCGSSVSVRYAVDQHPAGTSPKGLKDVLLAPSELLARDPDSPFGSCRGPQGYCSVYGAAPGAIDFVRETPLGKTDDLADATQFPSFAFRCVWNEGGGK